MTEQHATGMIGPELGVSEALQCLRRRWKFIIACAVLAAGIVGVFNIFVAPRKYTAATTLLAGSQQGGTSVGAAMAQQMLGSLIGPMATPAFDSIGYAHALLRSRLVRDKIVRDLDLKSRFETDTEWEAREALAGVTKVDHDLEQRTVTIAVTLSGTPWIAGRGPEADADARKLAADIANAYREELGEQSTRIFRTDVQARREFLAQRVKEAQEALVEAEDDFRQWQESHEVVAPSAAASEITRRMVELRVQQEQTRVNAAAAAGQMQGARRQLAETDELRLASATDVRNPRIDDLQRRLTESETALALAVHAEGASENHPDVRRHRTSIEALSEELRQALEDELVTQQRTVSASPLHDEVSKQLLSARLQKLSADAQSSALDTVLRRFSAQISQIPEEQTEFARKTRDVTVKEQVYQMLRMEYETAVIDEHRVVNHFTVLDVAIPPERKSGPKIMTSSVIAGTAGFIFAVLWVLMTFAIGGERKQ